ncbi:helix-turn-helix domain-containing protein [Chitinophaga polysaccharea]|uniref:GlxA family transcriptional regulator n=1 Tax=Chitinophaga polysaccharea TaxID=1293035 RepID=UPI001454FC0C|nr:helix-turn-helix domain-containing protein [Chitinophaga polysaccharea]NLR59099.1 helix-turn-helix domain-containing protein [Chitinophaga polysaccharea]
MLQIGILLTRHYKLLSLAAITDVLDTVNKIYQKSDQPAPFTVTLLYTPDTAHLTSAFPAYPAQTLADAGTFKLLLIPSFTADDIPQVLAENEAWLPWLRQQYKNGAELASFCTGAFLLAATGLLDGKIATTHVDACKEFSRAFPRVNLLSDKTVTHDAGIYTSGGATSTFHLLLHLLEIHCGIEVAVRMAKIFAIDMGRDKQSYFSTFQPTRNHHDDLVATAQLKIETCYQEAGTIEEMIKDIPSSRRNIVRRFKQVTGVTPIEYLQLTRIEAAKKLLEQTGQQMTEIIYNSGYNDPKAFRKVFRKTVGMTPSEYREKFNAVR